MDKNISNLEERLRLPLPGRNAQLRMAPSYRAGMDETGARMLAGVTILLYRRNGQLCFPLIERPVYNGAHSGQISFPGGKMDPEDKDLVFTALRECQEEIGIDASNIQVLGCLSPLFIPVSKFEVYPVIGYVSHEPVFIPQASEVVTILEVPVSRILDENIREQKKVIHNGKEEIIPYFNIQDKFVWGATAMILSEFIQVIKEC